MFEKGNESVCFFSPLLRRTSTYWASRDAAGHIIQLTSAPQSTPPESPPDAEGPDKFSNSLRLT